MSLDLAIVSTGGSMAIVALVAFKGGTDRRIETNVRTAESAIEDVPLAPDRWRAPVTREGYHGELFTAPFLVYDEAANRFRASAIPETANSKEEVLFELLGIGGEEYPVRLVGHIGSGESLQGIFACRADGETVVAGPGHVFSSLGLAVQSLRLHRSSDDGRIHVLAVVRDALSGEQVELVSGQTSTIRPALATLRIVTTGRILEAPEGAVIEVGGWLYRVLSVQADSGAVEIAPERAGAPAVVWRRKRVKAVE